MRIASNPINERSVAGAIDANEALRLAEHQFISSMRALCPVHEVGGFLCFFWHKPDPFYRNCAVPAQQCCVQRQSIEQMAYAFEERGRTPRLEFFEERWPGLVTSLTDRGFAVEADSETLAINGLEQLRQPLDFSPEHEVCFGEKEDLVAARSFIAEQARVFNSFHATSIEDEAIGLIDAVRKKQLCFAFIEKQEMPVSGAVLIINGSVAELAGVWTSTAWRGYGMASAICHKLITRHLRSDAMAALGADRSPTPMIWLSAQNQATSRLYHRLGFFRVGRQINMGKPSAPV